MDSNVESAFEGANTQETSQAVGKISRRRFLPLLPAAVTVLCLTACGETTPKPKLQESLPSSNQVQGFTKSELDFLNLFFNPRNPRLNYTPNGQYRERFSLEQDILGAMSAALNEQGVQTGMGPLGLLVLASTRHTALLKLSDLYDSRKFGLIPISADENAIADKFNKGLPTDDRIPNIGLNTAKDGRLAAIETLAKHVQEFGQLPDKNIISLIALAALYQEMTRYHAEPPLPNSNINLPADLPGFTDMKFVNLEEAIQTAHWCNQFLPKAIREFFGPEAMATDTYEDGQRRKNTRRGYGENGVLSPVRYEEVFKIVQKIPDIFQQSGYLYPTKMMEIIAMALANNGYDRTDLLAMTEAMKKIGITDAVVINKVTRAEALRREMFN